MTNLYPNMGNYHNIIPSHLKKNLIPLNFVVLVLLTVPEIIYVRCPIENNFRVKVCFEVSGHWFSSGLFLWHLPTAPSKPTTPKYQQDSLH